MNIFFFICKRTKKEMGNKIIIAVKERGDRFCIPI
jgi:hypothetical protein